MSETIQELYLKYINSVGGALEEDRYFRYLFEIVQAGDNVLSQNRQVLHKVVDESWLTMIEDTLDAINTIIEKPRRYVTRTEEVVPVSLARKITADSVRHLSMNTQFISSDGKGDIQPTRVLNVTTEESYDLYENRFIYHLIQKLVVFIDKRTDVIFWSTGDEIRDSMTLESKIDDAYEEIEYKVEMRIKNRQSMAENDADNMGTFMRIDRVRRLTMALRNSAFCEIMAGCAKVVSPIQRTNLMMKDPNYRKCYNLWQFLERYDNVGYTIEEQNTAVQFDEEYLLQMYVNLIANYTVFKSLSEAEPRNLSEAVLSKHQVLEPKFVPEIHEEVVEDYNIPDVEIRRVIIEEVTQAQLDAEAKAAEELALREAAEQRAKEAEEAAEEALRQSQLSMQMMFDAQERAALEESLRTSAEELAKEAEAGRAAAEIEAKAAREKEAEERRAMEKAAGEAEAAKQAKLAADQECKAAQILCQEAIQRAERTSQAYQEAILQRDQAQSSYELAQKQCLEAEAERDQLRSEQLDLETRFRILKGKQDALEAEAAAANERAKRAAAARREAERLRATAQKQSEDAIRRMEEAERQSEALVQASEARERDLERRLFRALRKLESSQGKRFRLFNRAAQESEDKVEG